jgi:hypothetical protein
MAQIMLTDESVYGFPLCHDSIQCSKEELNLRFVAVFLGTFLSARAMLAPNNETELFADGKANTPQMLPIKTSGSGKTFRERVHERMAPTMLNIPEVEHEIRRNMVFLNAIRDGMNQDNEVHSGSLSGMNSAGMNNAFGTERKEGKATGETPSWYGDVPFGGPRELMHLDDPKESPPGTSISNGRSTMEWLSPNVAGQRHENPLSGKSHTGSGAKTLKKRIKERMRPATLDSPKIQEAMKQDFGVGSPLQGLGSPLQTGISSASGIPAKERMVFAETPVFCGDAPFAEKNIMNNPLALKSDKGAGVKTLRKRIKDRLAPATLDSPKIQDDIKQDFGVRSALSQGLGSDLQTGFSSASGFPAKERMVFAETPLWCGESPFAEKLMVNLHTNYESQLDSQSTPTNERSTTESLSDGEHGTAGQKPLDRDGEPPELPVKPNSQVPAMPLPMPVPMGAFPGMDMNMFGMWNPHEQVAAPKAPVMIPVPVPFPVPMGCGGLADPSLALNPFFAASAGQDMYSAFLSSQGYPRPLPDGAGAGANGYPRPPTDGAGAGAGAGAGVGIGQDMYTAFLKSQGYPVAPAAPPPAAPPAQPPLPPGFVVPAGYKLVRAPGPTQDTPSCTGSPQSINVNHDRRGSNSVSDLDKKRTPKGPSNADSGKLFVGGLNSATTGDKLRDHFSHFGKVFSASVIKDPATKQSRGFGFVEFQDGISATVLEADHMIDGRKCSVKPYTYAW